MAVTRQELKEGQTLVYSPFHATYAGLYVVESAFEGACLGRAVLPDMPEREKAAYLFYGHIAVWNGTAESYFRSGRQDKRLERYLNAVLGPGQALLSGMRVYYQAKYYLVDCRLEHAPGLWYIDELPIPEDIHALLQRRTYIHPNQVEIVGNVV
jgi:hypothetical protein